MTGAAFFGSHSVTVRTSTHTHGVRMSVIALPRKVSLRMTVHAARVPQHGNDGYKQSSFVACCWERITRYLTRRSSGLFCSGYRVPEPERCCEPDKSD